MSLLGRGSETRGIDMLGSSMGEVGRQVGSKYTEADTFSKGQSGSQLDANNRKKGQSHLQLGGKIP